jgi:peptidoglycan/xylan/chitin deacetylase (PgdA/CDA1 family)
MNGPVALLTYHRIVPDGSAARFHDVAASHFAAQMDLLCARVVDVWGGLLRLDDGRHVVLTFDDGTLDHARVGEDLHALGLAATFFVPSGRLGQPDHLDHAQVRRLAALGHRIGSHAVTHRPLTRLAAGVLREELAGSRRVLEEVSGANVDWLAPPGGYWNVWCLTAARAAGYRVVRTMAWGYARLPLAGCVACLPVLPTHDLRAFERMLEGRASTWAYHLKRPVKRLLGEGAYVWMRDRWATARRERSLGTA